MVIMLLVVVVMTAVIRGCRGLTCFFFSSRRRHTRSYGDLEFRRVLFRSYALHQLRSDLRLAFYELLLSQQREEGIRKGLSNLQELVRVLGEREREGEGSTFDRLRADRKSVV